VLEVAPANAFHVPWLEGKLAPLISPAVRDVLGPVRVEWSRDPPPRPAPPQARREPLPLHRPPGGSR
jgi:hypothetical protein